jgi:hypothetical protein
MAGQFKLRMDPSWDLEPPLARQLKFRMELIGQAPAGGCKLARSLSMIAGPPTTPSGLLLVCIQGPPARYTSRNPASNLPQLFRFFYFKERFFLNARSVQTRRYERESPG